MKKKEVVGRKIIPFSEVLRLMDKWNDEDSCLDESKAECLSVVSKIKKEIAQKTFRLGRRLRPSEYEEILVKFPDIKKEDLFVELIRLEKKLKLRHDSSSAKGVHLAKKRPISLLHFAKHVLRKCDFDLGEYLDKSSADLSQRVDDLFKE